MAPMGATRRQGCLQIAQRALRDCVTTKLGAALIRPPSRDPRIAPRLRWGRCFVVGKNEDNEPVARLRRGVDADYLHRRWNRDAAQLLEGFPRVTRIREDVLPQFGIVNRGEQKLVGCVTFCLLVILPLYLIHVVCSSDLLPRIEWRCALALSGPGAQ